MKRIYSKDFFTESEPTPNIPDSWRYNNRINEAGRSVRTLYFYSSAIGGNDVTVPYGFTELQDVKNTTIVMPNSYPFRSQRSLNSVDLNNVPFRNNSMSDAFRYCYNLNSVNNIGNNVTDMSNTFGDCNKLNQNIRIPNSVTNMSFTFTNCYYLNQNIQIPNSVTDMTGTFSGCNHIFYGLNQNIQIPNSVTNMNSTFYNCSRLSQNIQIPNSVTNMSSTFYGCSFLNQNIQIPNSVTNMVSTFENCNTLCQNIQIPSSVTIMASTFNHCISLGYSNTRINILSTNIKNADEAFGYMDSSRRRNVYIYFRYNNGSFTTTYNTFEAAVTSYSNGATYTNLLTNKANTYVYNLGIAPA